MGVLHTKVIVVAYFLVLGCLCLYVCVCIHIYIYIYLYMLTCRHFVCTAQQLAAEESQLCVDRTGSWVGCQGLGRFQADRYVQRIMSPSLKFGIENKEEHSMVGCDCLLCKKRIKTSSRFSF